MVGKAREAASSCGGSVNCAALVLLRSSLSLQVNIRVQLPKVAPRATVSA